MARDIVVPRSGEPLRFFTKNDLGVPQLAMTIDKDGNVDIPGFEGGGGGGGLTVVLVTVTGTTPSVTAMESGKHYVVDMSAATGDVSMAAPAGGAEVEFRLAIDYGEASNDYHILITGEVFSQGGEVGTPLRVGALSSWVHCPWSTDTSTYVVEDGSTPVSRQLDGAWTVDGDLSVNGDIYLPAGKTIFVDGEDVIGGGGGAILPLVSVPVTSLTNHAGDAQNAYVNFLPVSPVNLDVVTGEVYHLWTELIIFLSNSTVPSNFVATLALDLDAVTIPGSETNYAADLTVSRPLNANVVSLFCEVIYTATYTGTAQLIPRFKYTGSSQVAGFYAYSNTADPFTNFEVYSGADFIDNPYAAIAMKDSKVPGGMWIGATFYGEVATPVKKTIFY